VQDYLRQFGARKVEANALVVRPVEGRELLEKAILQYVPVTALATYAEKLEGARTELASEIQRRISEFTAEDEEPAPPSDEANEMTLPDTAAAALLDRLAPRKR
jgi:hypothetical protein